MKENAELFDGISIFGASTVTCPLERGGLIGNVDLCGAPGFQGSTPEPRVLRVLLRALARGLQPQSARQQVVRRFAAARMRAFEKNEYWFIQTVRKHITPAKFSGHVQDRAQPAVIPPPFQVETRLRYFRLHWLNPRDIITHLPRHHSRRFLDQLRPRPSYWFSHKLRPFLHEHLQPHKPKRNCSPAQNSRHHRRH